MKCVQYLSTILTISLIICSNFVHCDETSSKKPVPSNTSSKPSTTVKDQITSKSSTSKPNGSKTSTQSQPDEPKCPKSCKCLPESDSDGSFGSIAVSCSQSDLKVIPSSSELPDKTTTFDLSDNQISKIDLFDAIPDLIHLNLTRNEIVLIEPKAFEQLPNLVTLDLSFNRLAIVEDTTFEGLAMLKEIDLSENDISKIEINSFDSQSWLEVLNLRGNALKSLPEELFRSNVRLRVLDLSHNSLYSLPDIIFHSTPSLTHLDLSENQFNVVPSEDLASATKLEELDISANMMKKLDHESFTGLGSLKSLKINNCPQLTEIDDYTFSYLNSLQYLEVKNNPRLNLLSPSAFFGITFGTSNLTEVDLNGNQLSRLTEHTLPVCKLERVDLRDNQWRCDCHFKWIKSCKKDDPIHQQIRCTSPLQLASLEIAAIDEDQFTCPAEGNGFSREIRLFRLFVVLFGVLTLVFMGFMVIYYLHKAKVIRSFGHKYQRMGSIHYVKDQQPTDVIQE